MSLAPRRHWHLETGLQVQNIGHFASEQGELHWMFERSSETL